MSLHHLDRARELAENAAAHIAFATYDPRDTDPKEAA